MCIPVGLISDVKTRRKHQSPSFEGLSSAEEKREKKTDLTTIPSSSSEKPSTPDWVFTVSLFHHPGSTTVIPIDVGKT